MTDQPKPVPEGYHSVTPALIVRGASKVLDFVTFAFAAKERIRMTNPDGTIGHAELEIGDSVIMVSDATKEFPPMLSSVHLYVNDTDATYKRALKAGGTSIREPANQFYGDRSAGVRDPIGNIWWISTHIEDVSQADMEKRMKAQAKAPR